jgi:hypothetical protein
MMYLIIGLFALGAVMGLILAGGIFKSPPSTSKPALVAHTLFVASALVLFIVYALNNPDYPQLSLILFIVAALGGFYLVYNDLVKKQPGPRGVVVVHALVAVTAFVLLLMYALF